LSATGSRDGTLKLWDVSTVRERLTIQGNASWVHAGAFSPDGRLLATGHGGLPAAKLWDAATGRELRAFDEVPSVALALAFAPDGKRLAAGRYDGSLAFYDPLTGKALALQ